MFNYSYGIFDNFIGKKKKGKSREKEFINEISKQLQLLFSRSTNFLATRGKPLRMLEVYTSTGRSSFDKSRKKLTRERNSFSALSQFFSLALDLSKHFTTNKRIFSPVYIFSYEINIQDDRVLFEQVI